MTQDNPLAGYFRTPKVQQVLPTRGRFFEPGELDMSVNGEVAIYPMTGADEIILKNPDALLNGDALERLFRSCVPGIKEPRKISVPDLDVLLLAIKLASGGDLLEIGVKCPKCEREFELQRSIRDILESSRAIDEKDCVVRLSEDLVAYLRPYDFYAKTQLDLAAFEEAKLLQHLLSVDDSVQEKATIFNKSFEKIADLNADLIAHCVLKIDTPATSVTEKSHLNEFIRNSSKGVTKAITDKLKKLSEAGADKTIQIKCEAQECQHEWETALVFDPSHFFD